MSELASLSYERIVKALHVPGLWSLERGSHIRLQKRTTEGVLKITVPAHRPVKRGTLSHILKAAQLSVEQFNSLV